MQNNYPKDNSFKRFHFKCNLFFIKDPRGIIQKDRLKLKISSSCLYCQFSLFIFVSIDGENSTSIVVQFSNCVIQQSWRWIPPSVPILPSPVPALACSKVPWRRWQTCKTSDFVLMQPVWISTFRISISHIYCAVSDILEYI